MKRAWFIVATMPSLMPTKHLPTRQKETSFIKAAFGIGEVGYKEINTRVYVPPTHTSTSLHLALTTSEASLRFSKFSLPSLFRVTLRLRSFVCYSLGKDKTTRFRHFLSTLFLLF